jgi:transposase
MFFGVSAGTGPVAAKRWRRGWFMLSFQGQTPIYLYAGVCDMRKSFDGLLGLIEQAGLADAEQALSGAWFVFRNRRADRLKILYFDRDGLAIWYKRLEQGRFQWPAVPPGEPGQSTLSIEASELQLILAGIDLGSVRRRKRYRRPAPLSASSRNVENTA